MHKFEKFMTIVVWILLAITLVLDFCCFKRGYAASWDITFLMHIFNILAWALYTHESHYIEKVLKDGM